MTTVATPPHPTDAAAPARHRPSARRLAHYTLRSVIAVLTDWAFLAFIVAMPTTMYLFFAGIYGDQVSTAGPIVAALMMVTMATYGGLGAALGLAEVLELSPATYRQAVRHVLKPGPLWTGRKLHTLNRCGQLEVIDGSRVQPKTTAFLASLRSSDQSSQWDWHSALAKPIARRLH